jgi:hypothetical protein
MGTPPEQHVWAKVLAEVVIRIKNNMNSFNISQPESIL